MPINCLIHSVVGSALNHMDTFAQLLPFKLVNAFSTGNGMVESFMTYSAFCFEESHLG